MSEPRDLPPGVVWAAVLMLGCSMFWLWPDSDSPRLASDVPVPIPVAGAIDERRHPTPAIAPDGALAEALGLTLDARRQIERVFGNALALDTLERAALEIQIDALPPEPSRLALEDVQRALRQALPPEQADLLLQLALHYRAYVGDARRTLAQQDSPRTPGQAAVLFARIDALRRLHFGDVVAQALFGADDAAARTALAARLPRQSP